MASSEAVVQFQNRFLVVTGGQWLIRVSSTRRSASLSPATSLMCSLTSSTALSRRVSATVVDFMVTVMGVVVVEGVVVVAVVVVVVTVVVEGTLRGAGVAERSSSQGGMA